MLAPDLCSARRDPLAGITEYATLGGRLGVTTGRFLIFATGGLFAADLNSHVQSYDGLLATGWLVEASLAGTGTGCADCAA